MSDTATIHKFYLNFEGERTNALAFIPSKNKAPAKALSVFSHGKLADSLGRGRNALRHF